MEVLCDSHEVLVNEKRKRTGEEKECFKSKHSDTSIKRKQDPHPMQSEVGETGKKIDSSTQPMQMKVKESAKKGKKRMMPT